MANESTFSAELSNSKVAAIFADPASAREAAARLRQALVLADAQVQVIAPGDPRPGSKLEPESRGIFRTMLRAHLRLGLLGAVAGAVVFAVLYTRGIPYIVNSAVMAGAVIVAFGAVAGLFLGGLFTLRPDHDPYITRVYAALDLGRTAVVVHSFSREQNAQAADFLKQYSDEVVATL
ncbi:MAG: hypothetical protein ABWY01_04865 [Pseudoxanthomonas sp.]